MAINPAYGDPIRFTGKKGRTLIYGCHNTGRTAGFSRINAVTMVRISEWEGLSYG
jgi:hypothetical protein